MKFRVAMSLSALALMVALQGAAQGATFMSDTFSYPDGDLTIYDGTGTNVSGGKWQPHSGLNFPISIGVASGQAVVKSGNPASEDANRLAANASGPQVMVLGDKWYYAAVITVNDERADPNVGLNNDYFMHFKDDGFGFRGRAYIDDPADPNNDFTIGLSASSGGQAVAWPVDLNFGQTYKIAVSYEFNTGTTNLWVDPVNEASAFITDTNVAGAATDIESLALRQDFSSGGGDHEILVDSVAIGDDFDSVFLNSMNGSNIPEPASIGLAVMAVAGIGCARRRRA